MDFTAFTKPSGEMIKNKEGHFTFLPNKLSPKITYDDSLITLIAEANMQIGKLSGIGTLLPNPILLIRPYIIREAVLSSKIEGTQASILDVFKYEIGKKEGESHEGKRVKEVLNYIVALDECLEFIKDNEISLSLIKTAHKKLMEGVRGQQLEPGEFRGVQNWIGPEGTKIEDATFVPPPPEYVEELLEDLVNFIQNPPERMPPLIQCALMHYQFESIHPFADGNGRIGRLLIPLLLSNRGILPQPLLYLSAFIEKNKNQYYNHLLETSRKSKWNDWIRFFLFAVITQANEASKNIGKLMELRTKYENILRSEKRISRSVIILAEHLFANPIVSIPKAADYLKITYPPAKKAIDRLIELDILKANNNQERNRLFAAHEILEILS